MIHIFFIFFPKAHTCPHTRTSTAWWSWPQTFFSSTAWWFCSHVFLSTWHVSHICVGFTVSCDIQIKTWYMPESQLWRKFVIIYVENSKERAVGVKATRVSTLTGCASHSLWSTGCILCSLIHYLGPGKVSAEAINVLPIDNSGHLSLLADQWLTLEMNYDYLLEKFIQIAL